MSKISFLVSLLFGAVVDTSIPTYHLNLIFFLLLYILSGVTVLYHKRSTVHSILQISISQNVTESGKTGLIHTSTEIQFLSISEKYTHALPRNTKYLAIDGQVCFYRRLFADAVKPRRCMSWSWGASIGLHGVPNCSSRQSGPPLWIVPVQVTY